MKDERYIYHATEHSVDIRNYKITSNRQLTEGEVMNAVCLPNIQKPHDTVTEDGVRTTYMGTDYGDDCQFVINEGNVKEDDHAKSLF
jgi:hypothetical protein